MGVERQRHPDEHNVTVAGGIGCSDLPATELRTPLYWALNLQRLRAYFHHVQGEASEPNDPECTVRRVERYAL